MIRRNRTPSEYIGYGLYLYFGLSTRNVVNKALSFFEYSQEKPSCSNLELDIKIST
ncbi:MAG TPA: hypothetical protein VN704_11540 [Verrucomicrobiae bacterium]|nr:hypothetical protein [Verrucomicrobiae bacterium]